MTFTRIISTRDENGREYSKAEDVAVPQDHRLSEEQRAAALLAEKDRSRQNIAFRALMPEAHIEQPGPERVPVLPEIPQPVNLPPTPETLVSVDAESGAEGAVAFPARVAGEDKKVITIPSDTPDAAVKGTGRNLKEK